MSTTYTDFFTGKTVTPAFPQYSAITLTDDITLSWPNQFQNTNDVVSVTMDITPNFANLTVTMPDAREVGSGFTFTINNPGPFDFNLLDNTGALILTIQTLKANLIWLRSNATQAGTWRNIPAFGGAGAVSSVNATSDSDNLVITGVPITTAGTIALSLQQDLLALTQFGDGVVGFAARTATNSWSLRTITGTANQIIITNPSGIAGNPTYSLAPNITGVTSLTLAGLTFGVGAANLIASSVNTNVAITPGGTGIIELNKDTKLAAGKHLKFLADNGVNYISFRAGASAVNQSLVWPTAAGGAGQVLANDGLGSLSWASTPIVPGASTTNAVVRFSNAFGGLKDSPNFIATDGGAVTGLASAEIGDLLICTSTVETISTRGASQDFVVAPNGNGNLRSLADISIKTSGGFQRKLRIYDLDGDHYSALQSPVDLAANLIWTLPQTGAAAGYLVSDVANALSIRAFPVTVVDIIPKFSDTAGSLGSSVLSISGAGVLTGLTSISSTGVFSISSTGATTISNTGALNLGGAANTTTNLGGNNASTIVIGGATNTGITLTTGAIMTMSATTSASLATPTLTLSTATASSSTTTGALVLAGGLGVAGAIFSGALTATSIKFTSTSEIIGTTTNNSAAALSVGEFITGTGSAVALTTGNPANICSIALTPGDWDVFGTVGIVPTGVVDVLIGGINTVSVTMPATTSGSYTQLVITFPSAQSQIVPVGCSRLSLSGNTTVYLIIRANFAGTCTGNGYIGARRRR